MWIVELLTEGTWTATDENAHNSATAQAMAQRLAEEHQRPARYRERGSSQSFTVRPTA